jgi:hypothetical protein
LQSRRNAAFSRSIVFCPQLNYLQPNNYYPRLLFFRIAPVKTMSIKVPHNFNISTPLDALRRADAAELVNPFLDFW